ncbi:MAG: phosphotransferase family protein [Candidatus Binatus sp.]|uniref:phosphotransferase family protein n=1 Tax=Candidatus Binatus sp. TaxID=2811406 RepID=UPI0027165D4C|nr:phosphotransferase family protein [Candidatus Binatus sp.]MDO8433336.1 phosphotransferase family protein [Candidatus Binatus sp.]
MSTSAQEKTGPSATVDLAGLGRFITERKLGDISALRSENISFGHSNEVHLIHFDRHSWALRRPPRGPLLPTAHDVMREARVLEALQNTPVPVPRIYAACDDPSYIGAPFYLMEYVKGEVIRADGKNFASTPEIRRVVSRVMVDLLADLQDVDWRAVGLEGFGRPDGYLERQLQRWVDQLERTLPYTRPLPVMDQVKEWLRAHIPASPTPTIVHGDFKLDNVMWNPATRKVIAVFDWEMSTIGDPLADFGWMLSYWPDPTDTSGGIIASTAAEEGYLSRREMIDLYEQRTGRAMRDFVFYQAFALFKLAIIMEGSYSRFVRGQTDDPLFAGLTERVPALADAAWAVCNSPRV